MSFTSFLEEKTKNSKSGFRTRTAPACGKYFENGGHPTVHIWHKIKNMTEFSEKNSFFSAILGSKCTDPDYLVFSEIWQKIEKRKKLKNLNVTA